MGNQETTKRNHELFAELEKYPENSREYRDIVAAIVKNNAPLVKYVVKRYSPMLKLTTLNSDDLMSDGYLGLLRAIKQFKEKGTAAFSTYAMYHIKGNISYHLKREVRHITDSLEDDQNGEKHKLKDNLVSPVNIEKDIVEKDETDRQMAWVRNNLDQLTPLQKQVLISRYLSGETMMKVEVLAKEFDCTKQNISCLTNKAIKNLRKIYYASHPEEIALTREDNSKTGQKLSTLREGIHDSGHLKSISEIVENAM